MILVEAQEVDRLDDHVAELGVGDARIALQPRAHGLLGHHRVDAEVLADVAQVLDQVDLCEPVEIVDHQRGVRAGEVEVTFELAARDGGVAGDLLHGLQVALSRLAAGIADHAGTGADDDDGPVTSALEVRQRHHGDEVADLQAGVAGVETAIDGERSGREGLIQPALGDLAHQATRLQRGDHIACLDCA